ncbi:MAG: hypothetical protein M3N08_02590 [Pseudomonadota bacterium]|nr:hypothetical protein [Pseudomonadota bacterium]
MSVKNNSAFTASQILLPLSLVALVVFLGTAFQTTQVFRDRTTLHQVKAQQDKPLEDTRRLQAQLDALAVGTLKLADQGDKNAQAIIERLKKLGITVTPPKTDAAAPMATAPEHIAMPSK